MFRSILVLTLLAGCSGGTEDTATGDAVAGEAVFDANCASCHGVGGTGGSSGPDLTAESEEAGEIEEIVRNGEGDMPAYEGTLDDQEIADVVAYVVSIGGDGEVED